MISDSLSECYYKLLKEIKHYSRDPWDSSYPDSQRNNIIYALYYLDIARAHYDLGRELTKLEHAIIFNKVVKVYNNKTRK